MLSVVLQLQSAAADISSSPPAARQSFRCNTPPHGFLLAPPLPPVAQMCSAIALPARFMLPTPTTGTTLHHPPCTPPHLTHHLAPPHTTTSHHHLTPPPHTTNSHHHLDQKESLAEVGRTRVADLTCWSHSMSIHDYYFQRDQLFALPPFLVDLKPGVR